MAHQEQVEDGAAAQGGISRRKLIATGATLAAAGVAVGATGMSVVSSQEGHSASAAPADQGAPGSGEPVIVYLRNAERGDFEVYVGDRRSNFTNRDVATQVMQAANSAE